MTLNKVPNNSSSNALHQQYNNFQPATQNTTQNKRGALDYSMGYCNEGFSSYETNTQEYIFSHNNSLHFDEANCKSRNSFTTSSKAYVKSDSAILTAHSKQDIKFDTETSIIINVSKSSDTDASNGDKNNSTGGLSNKGTSYSNVNACSVGERNLAESCSPVMRYGSLSGGEAAFILLAAVSSTIRELFTGCFRCHSSSQPVDEAETEQKGAWFDYGQMSAEQSFTYCNEAVIHSEQDLPHLSKECMTINLPTEKNNINKNMLTERLGTEEIQLTSSTGDNLTSSSCLEISNELQFEESYGNGKKPFIEGHVSFATKLEEDYRQREVDIERSDSSSDKFLYSGHCYSDENPICNLPYTDSLEQIEEECSIVVNRLGHISADDQNDFPGVSSVDHDNTSLFGESYCGLDSSQALPHVWEETEIEEAFGIYNLNAFYSYGSTSPIVLASGQPKPVKGKFEEVFPQKRPGHTNHLQQSISSAAVSVQNNKENVSCDTDQRKCMSKEVLNNIIRQFLLLREDSSFCENFNMCKDSLSCDNYFLYKNRRISKLLLFDLVSEHRLMCNLVYSTSSPLNSSYVPLERVQRKVFQVLDEEVQPKRNLTRKQNNIFDLRKYENDVLVQNLVASSLQTEETSWINYELEEEERKLQLCDELMSDLLLDTAKCISKILDNMDSPSNTYNTNKIKTGV